MEFLKYPPTRTDNTVDSAAGLDFPDPYRWLECDTEEVQQWQAAQNQLAQDYVQSWPHYERLKERGFRVFDWPPYVYRVKLVSTGFVWALSKVSRALSWRRHPMVKVG